MFRKRVADILRRSLKSLYKLDTIKEAKRLTLEYKAPVVEEESPLTNTFDSGFLTFLDPSIVASLYSDFNPWDPFQVGLGFSSRTPRATQGTQGLLLVLIYFPNIGTPPNKLDT